MMASARIAELLGQYVVSWTWQAAVVLGLVWLAVLLDRRHRPLLRYRIWSAALVGVLLLPWGPAIVASLPLTEVFKGTWTAVETAPSIPGRLQVIMSPDVRLPNDPVAAPPLSSHNAPLSFLSLAGLAWLSCVAFIATRTIAGHIRMSKLVKDGQLVSRKELSGIPDGIPAHALPVVLSAAVSGPALYGWLRPVIVMPADVFSWTTAGERALMIHHECIHYSRGHHWMSMLVGAARSFLFFHPLVRIAYREFTVARELACDEEVIASGIEPQGYAEAIIKVLEHMIASGPRAPIVAFGAAGALEARLDRLFKPTVRVSRAALVLLPLLLLLTPISALGLWQSSPPSAVLVPRLVVPSIPVTQVAKSSPVVPPAAPKAARVAAVMAIPAAAAQVLPARALEPIRVRVDQLKESEELTTVLLTIQVPYERLTLAGTGGGISRAAGSILIRVTNISGRVVMVLEAGLLREVPAPLLGQEGFLVHAARLQLPPGLYRLDSVLRDQNSGNVQTVSQRLQVVNFPERVLSSTLIMADSVKTASDTASPTAFQIGGLRIRPSLNSERRPDQELSFAFQIYGLSINAATGLPSPAAIETLITREGQAVGRLVENVQGAAEMTITKTISLSDFPPGDYSILVTVTDTQTGDSSATREGFRVQ